MHLLKVNTFVAVFDNIGIPFAAEIMNFVILTALLSVANSGLYAATRMLYSLSRNGMTGPKLGQVNKKGIPMNALKVTFVFALLSLLSGVFAEKTVFIWLSISASQLSFRKQYLAKGGNVKDLKLLVIPYQSEKASIHQFQSRYIANVCAKLSKRLL